MKSVLADDGQYPGARKLLARIQTALAAAAGRPGRSADLGADAHVAGSGLHTAPAGARLDTAASMSRGPTLALAVALTLLAFLLAPGVAAALPGWSILPDPLKAATSLDAVDAFGDTGLVVAGAGAAVAVSGDGGATWTDISASPSATLNGVAFSDADHGVVVGSAGTILVGAPDEGNAFAWTAATRPDDVTGGLRDVAMSGAVGYAVGTGGVVLKTVDGGATWEHESSPTTTDLNAVAISVDGDVAAAVGAQGVLLVNQTGSWETRDSGTTRNLVDVALPAASAAGIVYYCSADRSLLAARNRGGDGPA